MRRRPGKRRFRGRLGLVSFRHKTQEPASFGRGSALANRATTRGSGHELDLVLGMASPAVASARISKSTVWIGALVAVGVVGAGLYLGRPASKPANTEPATREAKAYVFHLELSDVNMEASENFMKQQVVEIRGKIANRGPRTISSVDVYCLFSGADGREVHRERQRIVGTSAARATLPSEGVRSFRLPFDSLPDEWNQAMPKLVIAQIAFADQP
jgi:hypothetical protein